ncbi:hypothetical protein DVH02_23860 [Streptomyces corynorhini]|uniref:Uncharacterized protein n=1 Tax=Streptomyces corynorhini TaxID=2282652 RepID=A0A370B285_9ACTN|nr:hypothetical protein DVH02_23860 [Streptomyces corynorhini]
MPPMVGERRAGREEFSEPCCTVHDSTVRPAAVRHTPAIHLGVTGRRTSPTSVLPGERECAVL